MNKEDLGIILLFFGVLFLFISLNIFNKVIDNKTKNAEYFLAGKEALWFKHHGKTYGCLTVNDVVCYGARLEGTDIDNLEWKWQGCLHVDVICTHKDKYETDRTIQRWVQDIKELR